MGVPYEKVIEDEGKQDKRIELKSVFIRSVNIGCNDRWTD